jgi:hypothetical protein
MPMTRVLMVTMRVLLQQIVVMAEAMVILSMAVVLFLSVFWIPGYPGPPAPGPLQRPSFSLGAK